jgi:hypothetical protein
MVASGEAFAVKRCEAVPIIPTLEFFAQDAFNILGNACLTQSSLDAGDFWCERIRVHRVDPKWVELDENVQLVVQPSINTNVAMHPPKVSSNSAKHRA